MDKASDTIKQPIVGLLRVDMSKDFITLHQSISNFNTGTLVSFDSILEGVLNRFDYLNANIVAILHMEEWAV